MSKGLEALERLQCNYVHVFKARENGKTQLVHDLNTIKKELKAFEILIKWYQPDIIHDLCCFGASDEEIALVKEILNERR